MDRSKQRQHAIDGVLKIAKTAVPEAGRAAFAAFTEEFYPLSSPDDLLARPPEMLFSIAEMMFSLVGRRSGDKPLVKFFTPKAAELEAGGWPQRSSMIFVVNDDMPFLVDSLTGGLSVTLGQRIRMMHHPVLKTALSPNRADTKNKRQEPADARRQSMLYVEIDQQSDPKAAAEITAHVEGIFADVRQAVSDWRAMSAKIDETVASLTVNPPPIPEDDQAEVIRFLRWMSADHFTFLGFREYAFEPGGKQREPKIVGAGLGILRDAKRYVLRDKDGLTPMSDEIRHFMAAPDPLIITKANVRSTIHRIAHMDYIGVKIFDENGKVVGERRFVGLFTSLAYSQFAADVPVLRQKVKRVQQRALFEPNSHAGKALVHILETFPRDELFQIDDGPLLETAMGVLQLIERPRPRAFLRKDQFGRFVSALVYVPREIHQAGLRLKVETILCDATGGETSVYHALLGDQALARWHFIIRTEPGKRLKLDVDRINEMIADAALGWRDRLQVSLQDKHGLERGDALFHRYKDVFPLAYRDAFSPAQAAYDVAKHDEIAGKDRMAVDFYTHMADGADRFRLKLHHGQTMVPLSACMPIFENTGFDVLVEHSYHLDGGSSGHIHDFTLAARPGKEPLPLETLKPLVEDMVLQVFAGGVENDRFNELVASVGMPWHRVAVLRAYGKYLRQLGLGYTPELMADCLVKHGAIAGQLWEVFDTRFDPHAPKDRAADSDMISGEIKAALDKVSSLDEDRILRAYLSAIQATLRTNFYQEGVMQGTPPRPLAFKISSRDLPEAPQPRPYAEIWVYSPQVEGVHLRLGPVARGGLRWSDRREDFRTEILGLVKAQQVKNAVIVPQGAKGGFYPKQLPSQADRKAWLAEGVSSYRSFISSLLSLTDNLGKRRIIAPKNTKRHDGDDPYLVVAADKGTATFSDISNALSEEAGFWLGDAFASGGSQGYDHKKMGITARGAWVGVERHFRELGVNVATDPIDVIGVGDMSGDVFGNGMLLSKAIRLKAAFNHMHIFIDPNPDPGTGYEERQRLFKKARSSWLDYDAALISEGGGIFARDAKFIDLSPPIKDWLKTDADRLTPTELINTILKAEADLLWFGGIGTYVRASTESDAEAGDRANDALRVTGRQLRVKAVGEGGNLGMTQQARIEFARAGGRLNTDFIDNSAGVDCSDKEVNIKILLSLAEATGKLDRPARNKLLHSMTKQVADIVLSDNYLQTQAISLAEADATSAREYHLGLIKALERDGELNREIEGLPSDEGFAELAANDAGLTRPELSVLLAYAKMSLTAILTRGKLVDDPIFRPELEWGFPQKLREDYAAEIGEHRLRREIIATVLANTVVNWAGLTFVYEVKEETGLAVEDIVAAFVIVREVFGLDMQWQAINKLDYKIIASVQYDMHRVLSRALKTQVLWLLRNLPQPFDLAAVIERYRTPMTALLKLDLGTLSEPAREAMQVRLVGLKAAGVPNALAQFVASFEMMDAGADVIEASMEADRGLDFVTEVYFSLGDIMGFDWIRQRAARIGKDDHWQRLAVQAELEDLQEVQRALVTQVVIAGKRDAKAAVRAWSSAEKTRIIRAGRLIDDLKASGNLNVAKLSFATRHLRTILS